MPPPRSLALGVASLFKPTIDVLDPEGKIIFPNIVFNKVSDEMCRLMQLSYSQDHFPVK